MERKLIPEKQLSSFFFEDTSHAISSEFGFRATPVIICNTDDPEYNLSSDKLHTAVALLSKL